jgi:hypothetical protein
MIMNVDGEEILRAKRNVTQIGDALADISTEQIPNIIFHMATPAHSACRHKCMLFIGNNHFIVRSFFVDYVTTQTGTRLHSVE